MNLAKFYEPNVLLHRDEQIREIENVFEKFKEFGVGTNKILIGSSGTGKTAVIQSISKKRDNCIYISAADEKTSCRILRKACPKDAKTINKVIEFLKTELKDNKKILIIDEINKVNRIWELFDDLNTIYRETQTPIILITNRRDLIDKMPDDAKNTLFFSRVEFLPYNAIQLKDIVKDRLRIMPKELTRDIEEGVIEFVCAKAVQESGSARVALDIMRQCLLEQTFNQDYINNFVLKKQEADFEIYYRNLTGLEKLFIDTVVNYSLDNPEKTITPALVSQNLVNKAPSVISNMITKFQNDGILVARYDKGKRIIEINQEIAAIIGSIE